MDIVGWEPPEVDDDNVLVDPTGKANSVGECGEGGRYCDPGRLLAGCLEGREGAGRKLRTSVRNQITRTFQCLIPLLNLQHCVVKVIVTTRSPTVSSRGGPLLRLKLFPCLY